ncbi:MAG TPA: HlyD family secretion protein [Polyangiaceae bacterium]|nr:HlyD family secretion protein [Polyangiaceae bacterium]
MATAAPMVQDTQSAPRSASAPALAPAAPAAPPAAPVTATPPAKATPANRSKRLFIGLGVVAVLVGGGTAYYVHESHYEQTDDAQIDGTIANVSPRVAGSISAAYVVENQSVKEGDVIAEIDPTDLQILVDQAKAQVAQAEAQLQAEDPSIPITQATNVSAVASAHADLAGAQAGLSAAKKEAAQLTAQIVQAEANDREAQLERDRSEKLVAQGAVSQSDFDTRSNAAAASAANVNALRQSLAAANDRVVQQTALLGSLRSHVDEVTSNAPRQVETRKASVVWRQASLDLAKAELAQAEKNLSYAKIRAPAAGIIAKKGFAVGDHVAPGQQLVALSQTNDLYVTANYRENQLERMRPGQPATIHVDALGIDLHGSLETVGGATGSRLSVLPPENASGNYVKVVQRIPVRIHLDPGQPEMDRLRIGMSVEPSITVAE